MSAPVRRLAPFAVVLATLAVAAALIDPFRAFMAQDDSWAYARSVEHLLGQGEYRLDAWSAANMPVQIYLAAALAQLFGYSFGVLRMSTLLLLVAGLGSLYALLRQQDVPGPAAAALTLVFLACPFVPMLGFTFMSDLQFVGWLLIAVWLYARGLERRSVTTIVLGSIAAACAIGTRQFGVAILGGIAIAWLLPRRDTRPPWRWLLPAAAAPLVATAWQLQVGLAAPTFTQAMRLHEQQHLIGLPALMLMREWVWRVAVVLQYLGVLTVALLPLLGVLALRPAPAPGLAASALVARRTRRRALAVAALTATFVVVAPMRLGSAITARANAGHLLPLPWMLDNAFWDHQLLLRGWMVLGVATTALAVYLLVRRGSWRGGLRGCLPERLLPLSTGFVLAALHLGYVQLNDTYLVGLVPFVLLLVAATTDPAGWPTVGIRSTALASIGATLLLALWMRGDYNRQEAQWKAADRLVAADVNVRCIGGTRHWAEYHGAYDDWLAAGHPGFDASGRIVSPAGPAPLHPPFYAWLNSRFWSSTAQVSSSWDATVPPSWQLLEVVPYRNMAFELRSIRVFLRADPRPQWAGPCRDPGARAVIGPGAAAR